MKNLLRPSNWFGSRKRRQRAQSHDNRRRLRSESLEKRQLLAADIGLGDPSGELVSPEDYFAQFNDHHNYKHPTDTNGDGMRTPFDALAVMNGLGRANDAGLFASGELPAAISGQQLDVNNDGQLTPFDALMVVNDLTENGVGRMEELVEHVLTIRDLDGNEIAANAAGNIEVGVNQIFEINVQYNDLRTNFEDTGVFSMWVDLDIDLPNNLQPVLTEYQAIEFDPTDLGQLSDANPATFTFSSNGATHTTQSFTSTNAFAFALQSEVESALEAFGYTSDQFQVSTSFGSGQPVIAEIKYTDFGLDGQDLPNISVTANSNNTISITPVSIPPVLNGEVNDAVIPFNLDTVSSSFNNQELYNFLNSGTFDPATGFGNVGGSIEGVFVGGIPSRTNQPLARPFDAFSVFARLTSETTGLTISTDFVDPSVRGESLTMFDVGRPLVADDVLRDEDSTVTLVTSTTNQQPPVVSGPITQTFGEADAAAAVDLLQNASDPNGDTLTVSGLTVTNDPQGAVTDNGNTVNVNPGAYVDALDSGETQTISLAYTIGDGNGGTVNTTATFTINGDGDSQVAPVVSGPVTVTFTEDDAPALVDLLTNASDANGDTLSVQNVTNSSGDASGITIDAANNQLSVTPQTYGALNTGDSEDVVFTYTIVDGNGGSVNQTATVTITGITDGGTNNPPALATTPLTFSLTEDDANIALNLLTGATDADGDTLDAINETLLAGDDSGFTTNGTTLDVNPSAYNALAAGTDETVSFSYDVTDGTVNVAQSVTVTVSGVNDTPTVGNALSFTFGETDAATMESLLTGAADVDTGDTLSVVASSVSITGDAAGVSVSGNMVNIDPSQYSALNQGENSVINLAFDISDSQGATVSQTATVTINGGTNQSPVVAAPLTETVTEDDATITVDMLQGASDPDGGTLSVDAASVVVSGDSANVNVDANSFTFDPSQFNSLNTGESAQVVVTYNILDGQGGSVQQTATINVTGITDVSGNNAPTVSGPVSMTFNEDDAAGTVNLLSGASDADGDTLTVSNLQIANDPSNAITDNGNSVGVDPNAYNALNAGDNQVINLSYTITDGNGGSVNQTATITITGENDGPGVFTIAGTLFIDHLENLAAVIAGEAPVRNGIKESDEAGLAGITVTLTSPSGATRTTTTDINGDYSFSNLTQGTYDVAYNIPSGVMHTGPTSGSVATSGSGAVPFAGPDLAAIGLQGSLSNLDIITSSYLASNQQMSALSDGGLQGGSALLDASGNQEVFVAGLGFENGVKFVEIALNDSRDAALLSVLDSNDDVKIARLSDDQFVVSRDGSAVQFFGGMEDFDFNDTASALLQQEFPTFRNAIDQAMADGI